MNLVEVVIHPEQQGKESEEIKIPPCLSDILRALSENWRIQVNRYDSISVAANHTIKLYYFADREQLSSSVFKQHIENSSAVECGRSIALLNFQIQGLCPTSATYFKDLVFLETDTDQSILQIHSAISNAVKTKQHAASKGVIDAFFSLSFVGKSAQYHKIVNKVSRVAKCRAPVLIEGETGTGKELLARALHYLSDDKSRGFVPINCAAIPDNLLESELFGHEKGAFTHAQQRHQGLIELAEGGTLFLDEVDSLSAKAQTALLRFLQSGEVRAVGSCKIRQANVRIVAASNTPLADKVKQQSFREDLYFRLNVLNLQVPPLRNRTDDIEILAQHMLARFEQQYGKSHKLLHPDLLNWLKQQSWPGNVRELENYLLRRYLLSDITILGMEDGQTLPHHIGAKVDTTSLTELSFQQAKDRVVDDFAENYITAMLTKTSGNVTRAAELAGKERRAFGRLIKKYHINPRSFQSA